MLAALENRLVAVRRKRWAQLLIVNTRFLIGFAFIPSGLKKVLDQPFTDPANVGSFHEFLHAFQATGWFYQFVGVMQLTAALLLFTQRFATIGALLAAPIMTTILMFCWSTQVYPTAVAVTLMWVATMALIVWDFSRWRGLFAADLHDHTATGPRRAGMDGTPAALDMRLWQACGVAILVLYFASCLLSGEIYRPRGIELHRPAFYLLPTIAVLPVVTLIVDQRRHRRLTGHRR